MTLVLNDHLSRYERQLHHRFVEAGRLTALSAAARMLFQRLCVLRRGLARDANVPAYQVLSNDMLLTLCEQRPIDIFGLIAISGFGQIRLRAYGAEVLAVLRQALAEEQGPVKSEQGRGDDEHGSE